MGESAQFPKDSAKLGEAIIGAVFRNGAGGSRETDHIVDTGM